MKYNKIEVGCISVTDSRDNELTPSMIFMSKNDKGDGQWHSLEFLKSMLAIESKDMKNGAPKLGEKNFGKNIGDGFGLYIGKNKDVLEFKTFCTSDSISITDTNKELILEVKSENINIEDLCVSDVEINNSTTLKHGLMPKLSGNETDFITGKGEWLNIDSNYIVNTLKPVIEITTDGTINLKEGSTFSINNKSIVINENDIISKKIGSKDGIVIFKDGEPTVLTNGIKDSVLISDKDGNPIWSIKNVERHVLKDENNELPERKYINFTGNGVKLVDDVKNNTVNVLITDGSIKNNVEVVMSSLTIDPFKTYIRDKYSSACIKFNLPENASIGDKFTIIMLTHDSIVSSGKIINNHKANNDMEVFNIYCIDTNTFIVG
jgi:hypothetical protein